MLSMVSWTDSPCTKSPRNSPRKVMPRRLSRNLVKSPVVKESKEAFRRPRR